MKRTMLAIAILSLVACGKSESTGEAPKGASGGGEMKGGGAAKPAAAALTWKKLDKVGLQIEVPSDVEVMDTSADAPGNSAFNNDFKVNVNETTLAYTDDFDKAKAEVEKDPGCGFKSWTKAEKTADGWDMEWVCESMIDKSARYGVEVRRTFGEKHYSCWEKLDSAEKATAVVKACTGIKQ